MTCKEIYLWAVVGVLLPPPFFFLLVLCERRCSLQHIHHPCVQIAITQKTLYKPNHGVGASGRSPSLLSSAPLHSCSQRHPPYRHSRSLARFIASASFFPAPVDMAAQGQGFDLI